MAGKKKADDKVYAHKKYTMSKGKKKTGAKSPGPKSTRSASKRTSDRHFDEFIADKYQTKAGGSGSVTLGMDRSDPEYKRSVRESKKRADKSLGKSNPPRKFKKAPPKSKKK